MNIPNAQYVLGIDGKNCSIKIVTDEVELFVPLDPDNSHYQAIQKWVAEGNTIAEAE